MFEDLKQAARLMPVTSKSVPSAAAMDATSDDSASSVTPAFCANCGAKLPVDARFCGMCGTGVHTSRDDAFSVILESVGENKILVIRTICEVVGCDLKKAKDAVESVPCTIVESPDRNTANNVKTKLEGAGAIVTIPQLRTSDDATNSDCANVFYDVLLESFGDNKIAVIKVVREATGLGLKEAKDLVEGSPRAVEKRLPLAQAQETKRKLEASGAKASIIEAEPSIAEQATTRFEFGIMDGYAQYSAKLHVLTESEGGLHIPIFEGYHPTFSCSACEVRCLVHMPPDREMMVPGDTADLHIDLPETITVSYGQRFRILENGNLVAEGFISETPRLNVNNEAAQSDSPLTLESGQIMAHLRVLTKEEGGRHTPFFDGYRPSLCSAGQETLCFIRIPKTLDMVMPGDEVDVLIEPVDPVALNRGQIIEIKEGGCLVATGFIAEMSR